MTWKNVKTDGYPDCDGETVYVGIDAAGEAGCFNDYFVIENVCMYETAEQSKFITGHLVWWQELELPE